ncbi:MAG: hypothetical protein EXR83_15840 [Gammaproteobacteria bacterium]|nr:hypothetical protein [Gammaproteobacteria bacterium]
MSAADFLWVRADLRTFKELDAQYAKPKGTAFRAFKGLAATLVEGQHFYCCDARLEPAHRVAISASERLYRGTLNVVFVTAEGCALLDAVLRSAATGRA